MIELLLRSWFSVHQTIHSMFFHDAMLDCPSVPLCTQKGSGPCKLHFVGALCWLWKRDAC